MVTYGAGHWVRTAALIDGLLRRFRVVLALRGHLTADLPLPDGVELVALPDSPGSVIDHRPLASLVRREQPEAIVIEYFPFGRLGAFTELVPILQIARTLPRPPLVLSSLRDVQQCLRTDQAEFDERVVRLANRYFDALLVHSDPRLFRLEETFARAADLTIPVVHTGYVVPRREIGAAPALSSDLPLIIVSAGGGAGGEALLRSAVAAQRELSGDFAMRLYAGTYTGEELWNELRQSAEGIPRLEIVRWTADLPRELAGAAVSLSRCGYNTALDLLRTGVPALVVPYATPDEDEQTRRAIKLAELGAWRWLPEERADAATLAAEIRRTAGFRPVAVDVGCDGAECSAEAIELMLRERAGRVAAC